MTGREKIMMRDLWPTQEEIQEMLARDRPGGGTISAGQPAPADTGDTAMNRAMNGTTAHRYFQPEEIAAVCWSMDRGLLMVLGTGPVPGDWEQVPEPARELIIEQVEAVRRGMTPREMVKAMGGDWARMDRADQLRREMFSWLVASMGSVQL